MTILSCSVGAIPAWPLTEAGVGWGMRTAEPTSGVSTAEVLLLESNFGGACMLHVSITSELFKSVFTFLVLGPAGALRSFGMAQFLDDLADGPGFRLNRKRAGGAAQAAIPFSLLVSKVQRDYRNAFAFDIFPNIQLGPVQQWMNPNV